MSDDIDDEQDEDEYIEPPIIEAARNGDIDQVRAILQDDPAQARFADPSGETALHVTGSPEIVALLIAQGADVNARGHRGRTPLYYAIAYGACEIVPHLIAAGADLNTIDEQGWTPLVRAFVSGELPSANLLLQAGAPFDLTAATAAGDAEQVRSILENDSQAVSKVPSAKALLTVAHLGITPQSEPNKIAIIKMLFEHRFNIGKAELLAAAKCVQFGDANREIVKLLRGYAEMMTDATDKG